MKKQKNSFTGIRVMALKATIQMMNRSPSTDSRGSTIKNKRKSMEKSHTCSQEQFCLLNCSYLTSLVVQRSSRRYSASLSASVLLTPKYTPGWITLNKLKTSDHSCKLKTTKATTECIQKRPRCKTKSPNELNPPSSTMNWNRYGRRWNKPCTNIWSRTQRRTKT